jgi:hypothetical protein
MLLLCTPVIAQQQNESAIVLDFASQAVRGLPLQAGRPYSITVINFNPLCFTPSIQVELQRADFDVAAAQALFRSSPQPAPDAVTPVEGPGARDISQPTDSGSIGFLSNMPVSQLVNATVEQLLAKAQTDLDTLETYRRAAARIVSTLENMDCAASWNISTLLRGWQGEREVLLDNVPTYETKLVRVNQYLDAAAQKQQGQNGPYASRIAALRSWVRNIEAAMKPLAAQFATTASSLDAAVAQSTFMHQFDTEHDVEGAKVTLIGDAAGTTPDVTRTFNLPMRRQHRITFSTGIVATAAPSVHYDRVNRLIDGEGEDDGVAAFSTFGEASGSDWDLVNPALFVSGSLIGLGGGASLSASLGTTLRAVNNQTLLEPLAGVGIGLVDRLFLQIGVHYGRRERLLISPPAEEAVPSEITRADAVGTIWKAYLFSGFSIRIN